MKNLENLFVNFSAADVLESAMPLTTQSISGDSMPVKKFESDLADLFGRKHAIAVSSGTISIFCALYALKIKPGDEVILSPTAVIMSALPAIQLGATVKFVDTLSDGFGIDPESLKKTISKKTRAVINVPMWGYPTPMEEIVQICKDRNVYLIEDISQSHATKWNGQYLGTFGNICCLSTQERKLVTTGEGGVVLTDDDAIAETITIMKRYGLENDGTIGHSNGLNFKMSAFSAAAGITQITKLHSKINERSLVAHKIRAGIQGLDWFKELSYPYHSEQNYYALVFTINTNDANNHALGAYLAEHGIISDPWRYKYQPLYNYPVCDSEKIFLPNAERLIRATFTLPCHEGMSDDDISYVVKTLLAFKPDLSSPKNTI